MTTTKQSTTLKVALSGAAGQIAYSLIPFIINGDVFGKDTAIDLRLLDITPMMGKLQGVVMEIQDCISSVNVTVTATDSAELAFDDIDYAILVGGFPRREGMDRRDLLDKNRPIFVTTGRALSVKASPTAKILVVANPANTNALVLSKNCSLPARNITALTRLDHNRATGLLSRAANVPPTKMQGVVIWGNHSKTQVPDVTNVTVSYDNSDKLIDVTSLPATEGKKMTLEKVMETVQQRGAEVIKARGLSSAMSAASAIRDHLRDWHFGTKETSMAVLSDGNPYGVAEGLFYSFPVSIINGEWKFVEGKKVNDMVKVKMDLSEKELLEEKNESLM